MTSPRPWRRYPWRRYWTPSGRGFEEGFFPDPEDASWHAFGLEAFELNALADDPCLVLLGEPGLGKSQAINDAVTALDGSGLVVHAVSLGAYDDGAALIGAIVDAPIWRKWRTSHTTMYLFLDGVDEAMLHIKGIHRRVISEIAKIGRDVTRLRLRVSCRAADWFSDFDDDLARVFAPARPRRLGLAPLRAVDLLAAAAIEGIAGEPFLNEVFERDLGRLAASPLTLRMMLDTVVAAGTLPETQGELFEQAILRLLEEHDQSRRRETVTLTMHVGRRIAVAERIAAGMLLSGRAATASDLGGATGGDVQIRELSGFPEQDPLAAGDAHFEIDVAQLQEVLATALFVDAGGGRMTFWPRSLGEFLAARYLVRHDMDTEQIMSLVASADDPDGRFIPQLREITVWAAAADRGVLDEVLVREPELLLRSDAPDVPVAARAQVVAGLLREEPALRVDRWDRRISFGTLRHDGLVDQLRVALTAAHDLPVRQMALTIAQACELPELQPSLLAIALDKGEPAHLRDDAIWALKDYADEDIRRSLAPLAIERIDDDTAGACADRSPLRASRRHSRRGLVRACGPGDRRRGGRGDSAEVGPAHGAPRAAARSQRPSDVS